MVLHHEVEEVRGALLGRAVKRLAVESLLDRAEEAGQRLVALEAEKVARLAMCGKDFSQTCDRAARFLQRERRHRRAKAGGGLRQAPLVVLEQPVPGAGVVVHDLEHRPALVRDQLMGDERPCEQAHRLLEIAQAVLPEPSLVQREAAQQVSAQRARGPDAELRAAPGVDAVADGEDRVEVEELDFAEHFPAGFELNCCIFCNSCRSLQLVAGKHVVEMPGDHGLVAVEERRDLVEREPDRVALEADVHPDLAVGGFVDDDFTVREMSAHGLKTPPAQQCHSRESPACDGPARRLRPILRRPHLFTSLRMKASLAALAAVVSAFALTACSAASPLSGVLDSPGPAPDRADKLALYAFLVGDWDTRVLAIDEAGERHESRGEIHADWVLEGRAIQDVWLTPPRSERPAPGAPLPELPVTGAWYGTTLRVYDPALDAWRIQWIDPATRFFAEQIGRAEGPDIVQRGEGPGGTEMRWRFTEIEPDSFLWIGEVSADGGATWRVQVEVRATRCAR
jgi:hypothetical protein